MNFEQEIKILLLSQNFYIYIITEEEERLEYILSIISQDLFRRNICVWNFIDGYNNNPNYLKKGQKNPLEALEIIQKSSNNEIKVFFLKDFYLFMNDLTINRKIKNLREHLKQNRKYVIISGQENKIPETIQEYITPIKLPLPNKKEIYLETHRFLSILKLKPEIFLEDLSKAYQGFSINRIRKSMSEIVVNKKLQLQIQKNILKEKEKIIKQTEIIEFYSINEKLSDIGGLHNLKKWLRVRTSTFTIRALNYGIKSPKGLLLVGIQGTGKSLSAKAISKEWNLPLLKLNISKIFASILGESERRVQKVLNMCEQISPCILWIDEIDKIFTQYKTTNDSGTTSRVTNIFLTWLSEKQQNVFVVGTANTIANLPVEMIRKGRFDEIFFVDLPNFQERLHIFKIHLKKVRPLTWHKYNLYYLSKISPKFSGAEIEQSIIDAMYNAFYKNREFSTNDIVKSIKNIIPLAIINESKVLEMKEWVYSGKIKIA
uniref:Uncharacterized AAA domain-containing protein ycf46 n=1 Tax=Cliftonaea pectinata TaxID=2007206 RepID=A0A1Z1MQI3_9FLOR|nr:hypothetical protein [Cliftonaea pectinata]ARW68004.1 hypothetical protein [Cliftonaea pectinata]